MKKESFLKTALLIFGVLLSYYFLVDYPRAKEEKALDAKIARLDNAIQLDGKTLDVAVLESFGCSNAEEVKKVGEIYEEYLRIEYCMADAKRDQEMFSQHSQYYPDKFKKMIKEKFDYTKNLQDSIHLCFKMITPSESVAKAKNPKPDIVDLKHKLETVENLILTSGEKAVLDIFKEVFQTNDMKELTELAIVYSGICVVKSQANYDKQRAIYEEEAGYKCFEEVAEKNGWMRKLLTARKAICEHKVRMIENKAEEEIFHKLEAMSNILYK